MSTNRTKSWNTVAIVGVGLIGGSIGLALRQRRLSEHVVGIGRRASSLQKALRCGAVTRTTTNLAKGVEHAELVVVCTPVSAIPGHVRQVAGACPPEALITDAGSTKAHIVSELESQLPREVAFVGSHPLAGSEKTGPEAARHDLFQDRPVVVTPTRRTRERDVQATIHFWSALGGDVVTMSAQAHDAAVAATSHVPHLVAALLAAATPEKYLSLVSTGWLDTTRIAGGDVQLWMQILRDNRANVLQGLDRFATVLDATRQALQQENERDLAKLLEKGKKHRDTLGS